MKVLLSGKNGFIGSHLAARLEQLGHKAEPIERGLSQGDLKRVLEGADYIFHLGAYGNMSGQTDEQMIFDANVVGTWNLLQASKDIPYKAFINFGSSSEYGKKQKPMKESDLPEADTFYGVSKVAGTYLARAFKNKPIVTVRPFSVYGEGEADFRFIPTIIRSIKERRIFTLDPKPKHDWIYIDDFINGVLKVCGHADKLSGRVVNIGTGKQYSNEEVVKTIIKISGQKEIRWDTLVNMREYDTDNWVADNSILKILGWKQKYSLEEGLKRVYDSK